MKTTTTTLTIIAMLVMSLVLCVLEILLNLQEKFISESTEVAWSIIFFISSIYWAYYDADREDFEKPFDFGFFVYVFWWVLFPWYLIKTRGIDGVLLYLGFIAIWIAPWVSGLVAYAYFT